MSIAPHRLTAAISAAQQVMAELADHGMDDVLSAIESETDALELMDKLLERIVADELLADRANERAKRLNIRAEHTRDVVERMMEALEQPKLERPLATVSLVNTAPRAVVVEPGQIPAAYLVTKPDLAALTKALRDGAVPGAVLSNPKRSLRLLTK